MVSNLPVADVLARGLGGEVTKDHQTTMSRPFRASIVFVFIITQGDRFTQPWAINI
jgi:hypothetical protein